jgi:hypothetical protein
MAAFLVVCINKTSSFCQSSVAFMHVVAVLITFRLSVLPPATETLTSIDRLFLTIQL